ncbi:hypothetical protein SESBI_47696 [Sesbania bispinosa]|nr:hypothetical protein SESBI_47696 [Sesbania bispinosa]
MSGKLIRELAMRWDESGGGFRVRRRVVRFSPLDVCFALGLRIVGEKVQFEDGVESYTKGLFGNGEITAASIVGKLRELHSDRDANDFFGGVAVYEKLVCSLSRARERLNEVKNSHEINVTGCTTVLENWVVDHLCLQRPKSKAAGNLFPRFLTLCSVVVRGRQIAYAFERNGVFHDLAATNEELEHEVVKEAMRFAPSGYCHWRETIHDVDSLHEEHLQIVAKNKELQNRISILEEEVLMLKHAIQSVEGINLSQDEGRRSVEGQFEGDYTHVEGRNVDFVSKGSSEEILTEPILEESKKHEGSKVLMMKQAIQRGEGMNLSHDEGRTSVARESEADYVDMEGGNVDFVTKVDLCVGAGFIKEILTKPDLEESKKHEGSNIYTRLKGQPRKRVISARVRSPWMAYYRKRKKQEV